MGKVAIYARVSTLDKQDSTRQIDELKAIILNRNYSQDDIDVYSENISGYKREERVQLQTLLKKVEANPKLYDSIYTSEISRIGRNPNHTRQIIDRWSELGVPLYIQSLNQSTVENGKRNAIMNIVLQVLMEYADMEAETFKTRSKSGLLASAKKGKVGGGKYFAYGYTADKNGYLVVDESEAAVICEIFDLYSKGNGIKIISGILNKRKIQTRTNKIHSKREKNVAKSSLGSTVVWSDKQVHDIIKNTIYKGNRNYKNEIVKAPRIISDDLFDRCTELRTQKTHRNYLTTYTYLLKDISVCGICGRNYFAKYKPVKHGDKVYICSSRLLPQGNCGNVGVNITLIESAIYNIVFENDLILKYLNDTDKMIQKLKEEIVQLTQKLSIEELELTQANDSFKRLNDLYIAKGNMKIEKYLEKEEEIENRIKNITERIPHIKKEISNKQESLVKFSSKKGTKESLTKARANRSDLQAIYKRFITKVVVDKIDLNSVVIAVYMQINGVKLDNPLLLMLDLKGIKRKPILYRYKAIYTDFTPNAEGDSFEFGDFDFKDWIKIEEDALIRLEENVESPTSL